MNKSEKFYPVNLNLSGKKVLVIGGGNVASRKVKILLEYKAEITILSPKISGTIKELAESGQIKLLNRTFRDGDIKGFDIVFYAATGTSLAKKVAAEAKLEGALLNSAVSPKLSDFYLPAKFERGSLTISISSEGKAPFYVKHIRKRLEEIFTERESVIIDLAGKLRKQVLASGLNRSEKSDIYEKFVETDWNMIIKQYGVETAEELINDWIKEAKK